jgi:AcrR family transcriptional regulator
MSFEQNPLAPEALARSAYENDPRPARERLLDGIADAVAEKGYADTTIADIVAAARVSKRTVYQHFTGKEACFTALYVTASTRSLTVLRDTVDTSLGWHAQVERAISAYLSILSEQPKRARTLYIEILRMGEAGLALRRSAHHRFASWIVEVLETERPLSDDVRVMAFALACAVIGGIHELILEYLERDDCARLLELVAPSSRLIRSVFSAAI